MSKDRKVSGEVKQHRREALDAGQAAYSAAMAAGDQDAARRELDTLKALDLLVDDGSGRWVPGPDVAD